MTDKWLLTPHVSKSERRRLGSHISKEIRNKYIITSKQWKEKGSFVIPVCKRSVYTSLVTKFFWSRYPFCHEYGAYGEYFLRSIFYQNHDSFQLNFVNHRLVTNLLFRPHHNFLSPDSAKKDWNASPVTESAKTLLRMRGTGQQTAGIVARREYGRVRDATFTSYFFNGFDIFCLMTIISWSS